MRKLLGGAATLGCLVALAMPGVAAAQEPECNTTVSCAEEFVNETVDATLALVNQKIEEAKLLVEQVRRDVEARSQAGVHECVVMARIKPDGTGSGSADCVRRYVRTTNPIVTTGTVAIQGARIVSTPTGPVVRFSGAVNPIVFTDTDGSVSTITHLTDHFVTAGGLSLHVGEYDGAGPAETAIAAFHTHTDVFGGTSDHFINGAVTLEGVA
jgi:hypothetical protein